MTREEYRAALSDVVYLVSCAVREAVPDRGRVEAMELTRLYAVAEYHRLTAAAAYALEAAGVHDPAFTQAKAKAIRKVALMDAEMAGIFARLEAAGIWYMPLKGTVLKAYYPRFGMREMADRDILFDASRADDVRAIMVGLGYEAKHFGAGIHDSYYKKPVSNFEMHRALFGAGHAPALCEYYGDVERRLLGDGYAKRFTPEDFYVYMIAHEHKHYSGGGTGLRSVLDTYVYLSKERLDLDYVEAQCGKLGIGDFERVNRSLAMRLFEGGELTAAEREMLGYIAESGTYGTVLHSVQNRLERNGWSKLRYALERFSVPVSRKNRAYDAYAGCYPVFYKYKILLFLLPFYRILSALKAGRFQAEARAIKRAKGRAKLK